MGSQAPLLGSVLSARTAALRHARCATSDAPASTVVHLCGAACCSPQLQRPGTLSGPRTSHMRRRGCTSAGQRAVGQSSGSSTPGGRSLGQSSLLSLLQALVVVPQHALPEGGRPGRTLRAVLCVLPLVLPCIFGPGLFPCKVLCCSEDPAALRWWSWLAQAPNSCACLTSSPGRSAQAGLLVCVRCSGSWAEVGLAQPPGEHSRLGPREARCQATLAGMASSSCKYACTTSHCTPPHAPDRVAVHDKEEQQELCKQQQPTFLHLSLDCISLWRAPVPDGEPLQARPQVRRLLAGWLRLLQMPRLDALHQGGQSLPTGCAGWMYGA